MEIPGAARQGRSRVSPPPLLHVRANDCPLRTARCSGADLAEPLDDRGFDCPSERHVAGRGFGSRGALGRASPVRCAVEVTLSRDTAGAFIDVPGTTVLAGVHDADPRPARKRAANRSASSSAVSVLCSSCFSTVAADW